jgi:hypothetical protein
MSDDRTNPERQHDIGAASAGAAEGMSDSRNDALFPTSREHAAEGVGGLGGAAVGAAIGAAGGPVGAVVGALAGAVGGWWAGKGIADATGSFDEKEDAHYRAQFESDPERVADRSYEDVRPYYVMGHVAACNPDYRSRSFTEIESDLQTHWDSGSQDRRSAWSAGRRYAERAFERRKLTTQVPGAANIAAGTVSTPGGTGL